LISGQDLPVSLTTPSQNIDKEKGRDFHDTPPHRRSVSFTSLLGQRP